MVEQVQSKNATAKFNIEHQVISPGIEKDKNFFEIELDLRVPSWQNVVYKTSVLESMKKAWV